MKKRIIIPIFIIFFSFSSVYAAKFSLIYNSPNFNIYLSKYYKGEKLIIDGKIENLYYIPLIDIFGYVDGISHKRVIEKKEFYIDFIGAWEDIDSKKYFHLVFTNGKRIKKLKFTINFNYAGWKESMNNYEYFIVKLNK